MPLTGQRLHFVPPSGFHIPAQWAQPIPTSILSRVQRVQALHRRGQFLVLATQSYEFQLICRTGHRTTSSESRDKLVDGTGGIFLVILYTYIYYIFPTINVLLQRVYDKSESEHCDRRFYDRKCYFRF